MAALLLPLCEVIPLCTLSPGVSSSPYKDTNQTGSGPYPSSLTSSSPLFKGPISKTITEELSIGLERMSLGWGGKGASASVGFSGSYKDAAQTERRSQAGLDQTPNHRVSLPSFQNYCRNERCQLRKHCVRKPSDFTGFYFFKDYDSNQLSPRDETCLDVTVSLWMN